MCILACVRLLLWSRKYKQCTINYSQLSYIIIIIRLVYSCYCLCVSTLSLSLPPPLPPLSFSHSLSPSLQLIGLALIGFGIYLLVGDNTLRVLTGNEFASDGALILVAGVITAIISFVGILGAAGKWPVVLGFVS